MHCNCWTSCKTGSLCTSAWRRYTFCRVPSSSRPQYSCDGASRYTDAAESRDRHNSLLQTACISSTNSAFIAARRHQASVIGSIAVRSIASNDTQTAAGHVSSCARDQACRVHDHELPTTSLLQAAIRVIARCCSVVQLL